MITKKEKIRMNTTTTITDTKTDRTQTPCGMSLSQLATVSTTKTF